MSEEPKQRLSGLDTGRDRSAHLDPKHSRLVRRMRFALPAGILAIFAVLLAWPQMDTSFEPIPIEEQNLSELNPKRNASALNAMVEPRFESQDKKNQPYVITADVAEQDTEDENLVFLTRPTGKVSLTGGDTVNIDAKTGIYHQTKGFLQLKGDVVIAHSDGYTLRTQSLFINISQASANTKNAVFISGPAGDIEAPAMKISPDGMNVYFEGPAKTVLKDIGNGLL